MIREWKRRQQVMETAGLDSTKEKNKVREWQKRNRELLSKNEKYLKRNYAREKVYLSSKNGKINTSDIKISGALDPSSKRAEKHAEKYYEEIRKRKTDFKKISKNTGISEQEIKRIKNYLFVDKHELSTGLKRFDPDYSISESWRRLTEGKNIQKHDLTLLKHEQYEYELVKNGMPQDKAHIEASKTYDYDKELREYYDKVKRNKKE